MTLNRGAALLGDIALDLCQAWKPPLTIQGHCLKAGTPQGKARADDLGAPGQDWKISPPHHFQLNPPEIFLDPVHKLASNLIPNSHSVPPLTIDLLLFYFIICLYCVYCYYFIFSYSKFSYNWIIYTLFTCDTLLLYRIIVFCICIVLFVANPCTMNNKL